MNHNQAVGRFGEDLARQFLIRRGYLILGANVKLGYEELDLVARLGELTVFVEVKTRLSRIYGPAENALAGFKLERFRRGIQAYLRGKHLSFDDIRADLITVDLDRERGSAKIKHYRDVL